MSPTFLRFFVAAAVAGGLFVPHFAFAQLDQKCWTKTACTEARKRIIAETQDTLTQTQIDDGFWQDGVTEKACGGLAWGKEPVGFCLPAGKATTEISFGGENRFSDIGQFIKSMYRYTIWSAAILAAAMLIVAGFQWAASGGSSDAISSAKKKISGAIAGLLLLLLSYTVLNTINPYLVNFRLPDVWLINKIGFAQFCDQLEPTDKVVLASEDPDKKLTEKEKFDMFKGAAWGTATTSTGAACGKQYTFQSGGGQTCRGTSCDLFQKPAVCMPAFMGSKEECKSANITGLISSSGIIDNGVAQIDGVVGAFVAKALASGASVVTNAANYWLWPWSSDDNGVFLISVCHDPKQFFRYIRQVKSDGTTEDNVNHIQKYSLKLSDSEIDQEIAKCTSHGFDFEGFGMVFPINIPWAVINDEGHLIGRTKDGNGIDLGDLPDGNKFTSPFYAGEDPVIELLDSDIDTYITYYVSNQITFPAEYLISPAQLKKGIRLNVDVNQICQVKDSDSMRKQCYGKFGFSE